MKPWMLVALFFFVLGVPVIVFTVGLIGYSYEPPAFFVGAYTAMAAWVLRHQVSNSDNSSNSSKEESARRKVGDDD